MRFTWSEGSSETLAQGQFHCEAEGEESESARQVGEEILKCAVARGRAARRGRRMVVGVSILILDGRFG